MARVAVMSVRLATTDEAGQSAPGTISKIIAYHGIITSSGSDFVGPVLADKATGFILKGVSGMNLCRANAVASATDGTPDEVIVLPGESEYLPAQKGATLHVLEVL